MIRINLAKKQKRSGQKSTLAGDAGDAFAEASEKEIQKQGLLRLSIILMFPLALFIAESQMIPGKRATLAARTSYLNELKTKNENAHRAVEEIKNFKAEQGKLLSQIAVLENLKHGRMQEVKILDSIQNAIPPKVWLNRLEIHEGKLSVQGFANTDQSLAGFMDTLAKSVFLKEVNLVRSTDQIDEGAGSTLKKFEIAAALEKIE